MHVQRRSVYSNFGTRNRKAEACHGKMVFITKLLGRTSLYPVPVK